MKLQNCSEVQADDSLTADWMTHKTAANMLFTQYNNVWILQAVGCIATGTFVVIVSEHVEYFNDLTTQPENKDDPKTLLYDIEAWNEMAITTIPRSYEASTVLGCIRS